MRFSPALILLAALAASAAPPPGASAPAVNSARELAQLIARGEIAFKQGLAQLDEGHDDEAAALFNGALAVFFDAPPPLRADPGFAPAFESLAGRVAEAELAAAGAEGRGPADADAAPEPGEGEPTPAELALAAPPVLLTPEESARLKATADALLREKSSDLPIVVNSEVLSFVKFYTGPGRGVMEAGLNRSGRYLEMMRGEFAALGLPKDLVWVALVESSFKPEAYSRAHARGIWQFITSTGRLYGLRIDPWVDERADPVKAVRAAARYFRDLHNQLGDWPSALAAYNSGAGRILRARRKSRKSDFFALSRTRWIPRETRGYVPIIMAAVLIAKDPARYGFTVEPEVPVRTELLPLTGPVRLSTVAESLGLPFDTLLALNPEYVAGLVPPGAAAVQVPAGLAPGLAAKAALIPVEEVEPPKPPAVRWTRIHRVRRGENFARIARRYRTSVDALAAANGMTSGDPVRPGMRLRVPGGKPAAARTSRGASYRRGQRLYHVVRRGETLAGIAARYRTTSDSIRRWNRLTGSGVAAGRRLIIYYGIK